VLKVIHKKKFYIHFEKAFTNKNFIHIFIKEIKTYVFHLIFSRDKIFQFQFNQGFKKKVQIIKTISIYLKYIIFNLFFILLVTQKIIFRKFKFV